MPGLRNLAFEMVLPLFLSSVVFRRKKREKKKDRQLMREKVNLAFCVYIACAESWVRAWFYLNKSLWCLEATGGEFELGRRRRGPRQPPSTALHGPLQSARAGWGPKSRGKLWFYFWEEGSGKGLVITLTF